MMNRSRENPLAQIDGLYHFTDTRNLALISRLGGLYSRFALQEMGVLGDISCGGNELSASADARFGMDRYVHLCFRRKHPMEYLAKNDGRIIESKFLPISPAVLEFDGVLFSPDVSNKGGVQPVPIQEAIDRIDFEVLYGQTNWANPDISARLRAAEKCEILVPDHVPRAFIATQLPNG